jgi:hypothetical protein
MSSMPVVPLVKRSMMDRTSEDWSPALEGLVHRCSLSDLKLPKEKSLEPNFLL